jgi:hypothetical protein
MTDSTPPAAADRVVRIASGQGFWGDALDAPQRQVDGGPVDYLMLDYLAEVTMSILQKQRERNPEAGYARDFVGAMRSVFPAVAERGVKVIANAGGVNPTGCAEAVLAAADEEGVRGKVRLGVVTGDDLLPRLDALLADGHELRNMDTDAPLSDVRDRVVSANAYIGSTPIVEALERGANVVITGRSTDTALTMAPLRYEFGWAADDWDRLAAGIVAGHILECGAQASGGNCLHDWRSIPDLANVGYPIAEARADGSFVVTKHDGTGGRVSVPGVTEQLVYEMGDPTTYITPDVVADFTTIRLEDAGPDRVRVHGIGGREATPVPQGVDRLPRRLEGRGHARLRLARRAREGAGRRPHPARAHGPPRPPVRHDPHRVRRCERHARTPRRRRTRRARGAAAHRRARRRPGVGGALLARDRPAGAQRAAERHRLRRRPAEGGGARGLLAGPHRQARGDHARRHPGVSMRVRLVDLAHARSGDKGDTANVGVIALQPAWYPLLAEQLTAERVRAHFGDLIDGPVERFELPNLNALNFLLHGALDGGGTLSLKTDAQGKVCSTALLRMELEVDDATAARLALPAAP